jgi:hypothetical protein
MKPTRKLVVAVLVLLVLGISQAAFADSFSTAGATGACSGGSTASISGNAGTTVNAGASVVYNNNNTISVTLTNCLVNPTSISQNISDIFFTITGASATGGQIGSLSASQVAVAANGTTTYSSGSVAWNLIMSGDTFHLTDLIGNAPTTPAETIIGAPNGSGVYSNANGSIAGNDPHNPFINQTATWTIACDSCSGAVRDVDISFGTTPSSTSVPEPASMALLGSGLSAFVVFGRRKFRK